jgi:hypothetical protein
MLDEDQPVAILVRQRLQQHAVDDTEDRGVRPDPQTERDHRENGESRILEQRSRAVAKIGDQLFEPADAARYATVVMVFFHGDHILTVRPASSPVAGLQEDGSALVDCQGVFEGPGICRTIVR